MKPAEFFESTVAIVHAVILWQILRLLLSQSQEKLQKTLKPKRTTKTQLKNTNNTKNYKKIKLKKTTNTKIQKNLKLKT
jgi:hypothetical protein